MGTETSQRGVFVVKRLRVADYQWKKKVDEMIERERDKVLVAIWRSCDDRTLAFGPSADPRLGLGRVKTIETDAGKICVRMHGRKQLDC